jgi:hypothetical protein
VSLERPGTGITIEPLFSARRQLGDDRFTKSALALHRAFMAGCDALSAKEK